MHHQESVRPQEAEPTSPDYSERSGRAVRTPVEGTVPWTSLITLMLKWTQKLLKLKTHCQ